LGVGAALGRMLSRTHWAAQGRSDQSLAMRWQAAQSSMGLVAAACVCAGLAQWWGAPAWAACLALGLTLRSATGAPWRIGQSVQQSLTRLAQVVLFALSALILLALISQSSAQLSQWDLSLLLPLVALIVCLRLFCQLLVCTLTAHWAGLRWQQGFALGLAMQPFSMTGLALLLMAWPLLMQGGALLASALVLAVLLSDVFAPLGLKVLLKQCGEMQPDDIAGMRSRNSTQAERIDTSPHANAAPWPWMPV
jgi:hypothetical protein